MQSTTQWTTSVEVRESVCLHAGEGWVRSMIAAGATTLAPVLGRMVSNPAGGPRPPSASKGSTSSSESCFPSAVMIDVATVSSKALLGTTAVCSLSMLLLLLCTACCCTHCHLLQLCNMPAYIQLPKSCKCTACPNLGACQSLGQRTRSCKMS